MITVSITSKGLKFKDPCDTCHSVLLIHYSSFFDEKVKSQGRAVPSSVILVAILSVLLHSFYHPMKHHRHEVHKTVSPAHPHISRFQGYSFDG